MLKFTLMFILTILLVFLLGQFSPFWGLMIGVAILGFLVGGPAGYAFLSGGFAFGIAWLTVAVFISINTGSDLPDKMASLLGLTNSGLLWVFTAILGFILGGFSALSGNLFRKIFHRKQQGFYRS